MGKIYLATYRLLKTHTLFASHSLEYLHSNGIVYRDTKPENFLLGVRGSVNQNVVHIVDFGLSKPYLNENGNVSICTSMR